MDREYLLTYHGIDEDAFERAVDFLIWKVPRETFEEVYRKMKEDPSWLLSQHRFWGMGVRNLLREGGFHWNAIALDDSWMAIVTEAMKRVLKIDVMQG
jgi:hypothetical protein